MTRFYFLDTETTGIDANATACEIAIMETDGDFNILHQHQSILDPEQLISPSASGVHGLTWEDCKEFPTIAEYFSVEDPTCYGKPLAGPAVVVGHRIGFDLRFVGPYFESEPRPIDTLRWARKLYPDAENHQLQTLLFALALPRSEGAHRAMADVMSAYHLCKHVCERTGYTLEQLATASEQPMEVSMMPFGKHKGTPMRDVPRHYFNWALNNMQDLDPDLRYSFGLHIK